MIDYFYSIMGFLFLGLYFYLSYSRTSDNEYLDNFLKTLNIESKNTGRLIEELTHAVYIQNGFAKNKHYFLFKKLGPTPKKILEYGGDCADKSRLLSALLRRLGIGSTLVMLHEKETWNATHTVVNAEYEKGWMAADPVFDIVFPKDGGGYYSVSDLKNHPDILPKRLDDLITARGNTDKIAYYKRETESYNWPKTINWNKNKLLLFIAKIIEKLGFDPFMIIRPYCLEDPKQLLSYAALFISVFCFIL